MDQDDPAVEGLCHALSSLAGADAWPGNEMALPGPALPGPVRPEDLAGAGLTPGLVRALVRASWSALPPMETELGWGCRLLAEGGDPRWLRSGLKVGVGPLRVWTECRMRDDAPVGWLAVYACLDAVVRRVPGVETRDPAAGPDTGLNGPLAQAMRAAMAGIDPAALGVLSRGTAFWHLAGGGRAASLTGWLQYAPPGPPSAKAAWLRAALAYDLAGIGPEEAVADLARPRSARVPAASLAAMAALRGSGRR